MLREWEGGGIGVVTRAFLMAASNQPQGELELTPSRFICFSRRRSNILFFSKATFFCNIQSCSLDEIHATLRVPLSSFVLWCLLVAWACLVLSLLRDWTWNVPPIVVPGLFCALTVYWFNDFIPSGNTFCSNFSTAWVTTWRLRSFSALSQSAAIAATVLSLLLLVQGSTGTGKGRQFRWHNSFISLSEPMSHVPLKDWNRCVLEETGDADSPQATVSVPALMLSTTTASPSRTDTERGPFPIKNLSIYETKKRSTTVQW